MPAPDALRVVARLREVERLAPRAQRAAAQRATNRALVEAHDAGHPQTALADLLGQSRTWVETRLASGRKDDGGYTPPAGRLSVREAAQTTGLTAGQLYSDIRRGRLPTVRWNGTHWLLPVDVDAARERRSPDTVAARRLHALAKADAARKGTVLKPVGRRRST